MSLKDIMCKEAARLREDAGLGEAQHLHLTRDDLQRSHIPRWRYKEMLAAVAEAIGGTLSVKQIRSFYRDYARRARRQAPQTRSRYVMPRAEVQLFHGSSAAACNPHLISADEIARRRAAPRKVPGRKRHGDGTERSAQNKRTRLRGMASALLR